MASVDGQRSSDDYSDDRIEFECTACKYESVRAEAKYFCPECEDYLCDPCKMAHQKLSSTRRHQIVCGSKMPKKGDTLKESHFSNIFLCSCNTKDVTLYCKDHDKVICVDCNVIKHRRCKIFEIDTKCADSEEFNTQLMEQHINELTKKIEILQKRRNEDIYDLTNQEKRACDIVKTFRKELNQPLDKMEEQSLADISKYASEQRKTIQQHIDTCTTVLNKLGSENRRYEIAKIADEKRVLFIQNLTLTKTIKDVQTIIEEIDKEIYAPKISFECDQKLKKADNLNLGTVTYADRKATGKAIINMTIKSSRNVDVRFPGDKTSPWISGSTFMSTGELVICDANNNSVKLLKTDFTIKEHMKVPAQPWDVSAMNEDEIVVTLTNNRTLMFVKVYPKLQRVSSLQFDQVCRGVSVSDSVIYVSFENGTIRIIDRNGQQQENVYSKNTFSLPYYISVSKAGKLFVSDHSSHSLYVYDNGIETFRYTDTVLQNPLGMYIDDGENVLLCGYASDNMHIIDKNGLKKKVLLSKDNGLNEPYAISFRYSDNTLIVGGRKQQLLLVFEME